VLGHYGEAIPAFPEPPSRLEGLRGRKTKDRGVQDLYRRPDGFHADYRTSYGKEAAEDGWNQRRLLKKYNLMGWRRDSSLLHLFPPDKRDAFAVGDQAQGCNISTAARGSSGSLVLVAPFASRAVLGRSGPERRQPLRVWTSRRTR